MIQPHPSLLEFKKIPVWYRLGVKPLYMILAPILIPIKIILCFLFLSISAVFDTILNIGTSQEKPLPRFRMFIFSFQKQLFYRLALISLGVIPIKVGRVMKNVHTIVCNHQSTLDILMTAGTGVGSAISKAGV